MLVPDIAGYLTTNGILPAASIFTYNIPGGLPDSVIAVLEYPGMTPEFIHNQSLPSIEKPRFQIVSRAKAHATARLNGENAYRLLSQVVNQVIGDARFLRIWAIQSSPTELDPDGSNRVRLVWNYQAEKEPCVLS